LRTVAPLRSILREHIEGGVGNKLELGYVNFVMNLQKTESRKQNPELIFRTNRHVLRKVTPLPFSPPLYPSPS
jgi:hypothetical protein